MKKLVLGLFIVTVAGLMIYSGDWQNSANTRPPDPLSIVKIDS